MTLTAAPDSIYCIRRWRKGEDERLVVDTLDGATIGYYDLRTGTSHADSQFSRELVQHVATHYAPATLEPASSASPRPDQQPLQRLFPARTIDAAILAGLGDPTLSPIFRSMVGQYGLPPLPQWEEDYMTVESDEFVEDTNVLDATVVDANAQPDEVALSVVEDGVGVDETPTVAAHRLAA